MTLREKLKKPIFILKGISTYLPEKFANLLPQHEGQFKGKGVRVSALHDTSLRDHAHSSYLHWLRTIVSLHEHGMRTAFTCVGEIGPGDTIGVGLCAMLSGSEQYFPLDVVSTAVNSKFSNEDLLEELIVLFQQRAKIPNEIEFPKNMPTIASYDFPSHILTEDLLRQTLDPKRIAALRSLVKNFTANGVAHEGGLSIRYLVPWMNEKVLDENADCIDIIVSFAAMEHVDEVEESYRAQLQLLREGGIIAHSIDYKCHHSAGLWNGHWSYSDFVWRLVRGRCIYLINRWPHSWHVNEVKKHFDFIYEIVRTRKSELGRRDLAQKFSQISDRDMVTNADFFVARKR